MLLLVSGCMATGPELARLAADRSLTTGSIPPAAETNAGDDLFSDKMTIRNAVSAADLSEFGDGELAWANAATGSRGVVSALHQTKTDDGVCRAFTTTLERYDGVGLYRGEICLGPQGYWTVRDLAGV